MVEQEQAKMKLELVQRFYVIENFETEFSRWTLTEFSHMLMIINGLYKKVE